MNSKKKIAIIVISTGKYNEFLPQMINSFKLNFNKDSRVEILLIGDDEIFLCKISSQ
jgi:hypothetical protein